MRSWAIVGSGLVFGLGLAISGMVRPEVVLSFLRLQDFGLLLVMGAGALVTLLGFWLVPRFMKRACNKEKFSLRGQHIDKHLIIGSVLFGIGWGIAGVCPGAGIASLGVGNWPILWAFLGIFIGTYLYGLYEHIVEADNYG